MGSNCDVWQSFSGDLSHLVFHICESVTRNISQRISIQHASRIFIPISRIVHQVVTHLRSKRLRSLAIVSTIGCHTPTQSPSRPSCQKLAFRKVRVVFSKPVHAVRAEGCPPSANHGLFKAKPSSYHVPAPCGPPVPPFLLTQNQHTSAQRLSFLCSAQCDVTKSAL